MSSPGDTSLTQCPHCDTVFQVSAEQLQVAQGRVRCGCCQGVFDALAHPYEQAAEHGVADSREPRANARTWETDEPDDTPYIIASRDDAAGAPINPALPDDTSAATAAGDESTGGEAESTAPGPSVNLAQTLPPIDIVDVLRDQLGEQTPAPRTRRGIAWSLMAVLLMLALGGQYLFFARADLAQYGSLRPWLQSACNYLGCELPLRHTPGQIELLSRDVISHPRIRNALLINATFVNRASFPQVYPVLQISLSNESGAVVAMRRFQPEEYLAQGTRIAAGMMPGAPVRVVLEVVEPKHSATSFQFEFL